VYVNAISIAIHSVTLVFIRVETSERHTKRFQVAITIGKAPSDLASLSKMVPSRHQSSCPALHLMRPQSVRLVEAVLRSLELIPYLAPHLGSYVQARPDDERPDH
jgi:hypothetical protein